MKILKALKEKNGGKLHLVGFSWGGLRAMMAYLDLSEVDRKGISLSLVDPLIPSLAVGKYAGLVSLAKKSNIIGNGEMAGVIRRKGFNVVKSMSKENITQGDVMRLIRHCIEQEEIIKKKLDSLQDKTVDIRQITLMGAKGMDGEVPNGKDGLGTNEDYVKFFRDIVLPKSKYGILNVMEKHSHNTFIGSKNGLYCGTDEFLKWLNEACAVAKDDTNDFISDFFSCLISYLGGNEDASVGSSNGSEGDGTKNRENCCTIS